jgi:hypothetical protein
MLKPMQIIAGYTSINYALKYLDKISKYGSNPVLDLLNYND